MRRVAIITGASRGIGREIAIKLYNEGYILALCCIENYSMLEELKSELSADESRISNYLVDVSDHISVHCMVEDVISRHGKIDLLVNNAGIASYKLINDTNYEEFDRIMKTNTYGVFHFSKECSKYMISEKSGTIINIASIWGEIGGSMETVYSMSKGAVISFTKALSKELAPSNIRVNAISPGGVDTDMLKPLGDDILQEYISELPTRRLARPSEIAEIVFFLDSKGAEYINGAVIRVDGAAY